MAAVQTSKILKYTLLPGLLPRIYQLFAGGFMHVPFLIATIYQAAGILPPGHAYLNPQNIGRYGIRHVMAEAANNLTFTRKNADQILIFFIILAGVVLLFIQLLLFLATMLIQNPALAAVPPLNYTATQLIFTGSNYNPGPAQDIAFMVLDQVFGVQGIFNSCISTGAACLDHNGNTLPGFGAFPTPFHRAMHTLLEFYSRGIFLVSVILIIYFVITLTAETAATGTPFGQRMNKTWAPIRLIVFFALLVPLVPFNGSAGAGFAGREGLNAAQLITLWSAKLGSNFATNAWGRFNAALTNTYLGDSQSLVGKPNTPDINALLQFMFVVKTCQIAENYAYGHAPSGIQAYLVREPQSGATPLPGPDSRDFITTPYDVAVQFSKYGNISIRFGELDATAPSERFSEYKGAVNPFCGELRLPVTNVDKTGNPESGSVGLQELYYNMVKDMWRDTPGGSPGVTMEPYAACLRDRLSQDGPNPNCTQWPDQNFINNLTISYQNYLDTNLNTFISAQINTGNFAVTNAMTNKGWAGAAIWYNRIAALNGNVSAALFSVPEPVSYPYVMSVVAAQRRMNNQNTNASAMFDPQLSSGQDLKYPRRKDRTIAIVLNRAYSAWTSSKAANSNFIAVTNNPILDTINAIFGTRSIFQNRCNATIHPLAQLSMLGQGMMYASLTLFAGGEVMSLGRGLLGDALDNVPGKLIEIFAHFFNTIAMSTIAMSFILFYVLPFMPFIYFFFALSGWVKAIFEAFVAMPLWALAHITRIDGNGLPGPAATNGYFLILEIFLRPILILFGLLASIQIFAAIVNTLNQTFDLVTANLTGFDYKTDVTGTCGGIKLALSRGSPVDTFCFTIIYVVLCYMMGLGCFKLIDLVPNTILRWAGVSVNPMTEQPGEAGSLVRHTYQGVTLMTGQIKSGGMLAALLK